MTLNDRFKARRMDDFAVLASPANRRDYAGEAITRSDHRYLGNMIGKMRSRREVWALIDGADDGIRRLLLVLDAGLSGSGGAVW